MNLFSNPRWIDKELLKLTKLDDIPESKIAEIRDRLKSVTSDKPLVTVIIAAWNEEVNIVQCLNSLSWNKSEVPFEVIVVNNNSTDRTQLVLDKLGVKSIFQPIQGVGPSRSLGQRSASGKYILSADADCLYPEKWIEKMAKTLMIEGNVFVYGRFCYLADNNHSRFKLTFYEFFRDILAELRHFKRPYLNSYGISLGYIKAYGDKEEYLDKHMRGFDGRLCFDIMKYGKVAVLRASNTKAWTGTRAIERDGSFARAILLRVLKEIARVGVYFKKEVPHDTKTSKNEDVSIKGSIETIKKKYNPFKFLSK